MTVGENIKRIRKERGLTQDELGNLVNLSGVAIMRYEKGQREPRQDTLIKIAKALGVHLRDLADTSMWEEFDRKLGAEKLVALSEESSSGGTIEKHKPSKFEQEIIEMFLKLDDSARSALLGYANRLVEEMRNKPSEQDIPTDIESQLERYRRGILMGIAAAQTDFSVPPEDVDVDSITPELKAMVDNALEKQRRILEAEQQK